MKYRISPFNIIAGLCVLVIVRYFFNAATQENYDHHGWEAVFTLVPSIIIGVVLTGLDFALQAAFSTKRYRLLIIIEISLGLIIFFGLKAMYLLPLSF